MERPALVHRPERASVLSLRHYDDLGLLAPAWVDPAAARGQHVSYTDGRCVQVLHRGPYSDEPASLARMDSLMEAEGLVPNGLHHEVHLSDPREEDPATKRAILRQPVR
ncbi:GyrI-like domain-containing protein [Actinomadura coerulea]|uniref:GyrI-like domain-containing protein n=1 Tax=Actinomadura coerulea TaxID=46159 RepID=UPI003440E3DB